MHHDFQIDGHWHGGRNGSGQVCAEHVSTTISLPRELGGSAKGTNPEEMLVGTAAACYLITLGIALEKRGLASVSLQLRSTGSVDIDKLKITRLVHEPRIRVAAPPTPEQLRLMTEAVHRAEQICLISNAIRGNVDIDVRWNDTCCEVVR